MSSKREREDSDYNDNTVDEVRRERNKNSAAQYRKRRKQYVQDIVQENRRLRDEVERLIDLLETAHEMNAGYMELRLEVDELKDQINRWVVQAPLFPLPSLKRADSDWSNAQ